MKNLKLIPLAAAISLGVGVTNNVQADVYALAYNDIDSLSILWRDTTGAINTDGVNIDSFSFQVDGSTSLTETLGGATTGAAPDSRDFDPTAGGILQANKGGAVGKANNDFTPIYYTDSPYARADGQIVSAILDGDAKTQVVNLAEAYRTTDGAAAGTSGTESITNFTQTFTIDTGFLRSIDLLFLADPYLESFSSLGLIDPSKAVAGITANFRITDAAGNTLFDWSPDGVSGGITNGTEVADPHSLNVSTTRTETNTGLDIYDPTGCGAPNTDNAVGCVATADVGNLIPETNAFWYAQSLFLGEGTYTLTGLVRSTVSVEQTSEDIPEPTSLALLGFGLIGLVVGRKKALKS